ncbi:MAG TPA: MBOAT family O-acyltransferase [Pyrinomonadaceae bacterium]|jgi:D-alanyl-lipoteichoic acid acyltransferase DltB (MBOAT superfamily)
MLFDSPVYFLFLILVTLLYWRLRRRGQNLFLLGASYFFYGWWDWRFALLMAGSTAADYVIGRRIGASKTDRQRRLLFISSLIINFSVLAFFKYFNFFIDSVTHSLAFFGIAHPNMTLLQILLPPGISFYTFQEVAYIVDVYKRRLEPADSLVDYALFISLFPHLIAGPIQRPSHLLPQVQNPRTWQSEKVFDGMLLILEGLFRKCVIADNCALIANAAFGGQLGRPSVPVLLLGTYAFAWQIYGDFSAYSSIARGSAQLLGFHFMINFRQPYLAHSLQEFWRRWHISLSTWLRDYLYIPLGGSRYGEWRTYRNLMMTMLIGGLWHGANWTFVIWGGIHGGGLALERFFSAEGERAKYSAARIWFRRVVIFHLVCLAWVFFRADSVAGAWQFLGGLGAWQWRAEYGTAFLFLAVFIIPLFLIDLQLDSSGDEYFMQSSALEVRIAVGVAALAGVTLFGANEANAFIYFQF